MIDFSSSCSSFRRLKFSCSLPVSGPSSWSPSSPSYSCMVVMLVVRRVWRVCLIIWRDTTKVQLDSKLEFWVSIVHSKGERSLAGSPVPESDHFVQLSVEELSLGECEGGVVHTWSELYKFGDHCVKSESHLFKMATNMCSQLVTAVDTNYDRNQL